MSHFFRSSTDNIHDICTICDVKITNRPSNTGNLRRHIQQKHPSALVTPPRVISGEPKLSNNFNTISIGPHAMQIGAEDLKLIHPFSLIVSGPTSSGKSTILFQILENLHQNTKPAIKKV